MMNRHLSTAERLRAVADQIEFEPKTFSMHTWCSGTSYVPRLIGHAPDCGSTCCVAGWAVSLTPFEQLNHNSESWEAVGARSLGLEQSFAAQLFMLVTVRDAAAMAACLRRLSKIPEGQRGFGHPDLDAALAEIGYRATYYGAAGYAQVELV